MNGSRVVQPSLRCLRLVHVICLDNKYTDSPLVHVSAEKKSPETYGSYLCPRQTWI
jgi:hypothetical protein